MTGTFIVSTPKSSMHALAFQGITASSCYAQIRDMLLHKFGDEYMLLFARPAENTGNGEIDWYSPVQGPVQKLVDLPEEEQADIEKTLAHMASEMLAYAEDLIHSENRLKITRGNILRLALSYPDRASLYVVGKQPVFTCWGFGPGTPGVEPENLWRVARTVPSRAAQKTAPPEAGSQQAIPVSRPGYLWWLLPVILGLLLFCLLFGSFGNIPALSGHTLFSVPGFGFLGPKGDYPEKNADLSKEIDVLESRLKTHMALCLPKSENKEESHAAIEPQSIPKATNLPKLVIPENTENTDFLEGRWLCETGLASMRTNEPIKVYIRFGRDGKGEATVYEKNDKCIGDAGATMKDDVLHIDVGTQKCEKSGHSYDPVSIDCRNGAGNQTECFGRYTYGHSWSADFVRVQ